MFIQTEATPNPSTLKFLPGRDVTGGAPREFASCAEAHGVSPLADELLHIDGVQRVFLGADFVSVSKAEGRDWAHLKPAILAAIMDHYVSGAPLFTDGEATAQTDTRYEGEAAETVAKIKELLDARVRPAVAADGGDIVFDSWDDESGVVRLHMRGACSGCPSSAMTLKAGIENLLKHYIPAVRAVEAAL